MADGGKIRVVFDTEAADKVVAMRLREQFAINARLGARIRTIRTARSAEAEEWRISRDLLEIVLEDLKAHREEVPHDLISSIHQLGDFMIPKVTEEALARRRERVERRRAKRLAAGGS